MTSMSGAALLVAEMVALFLTVTLAVTLLQRRLGDATIRRWMGGPPRRAALKGIAVGFITPFCTYSAIPVLVGMRQAGVRPAGYAAFIFAAPVVDPVMIGVLAIIIGPAGAAVYLTTAFAAAFLLALIVDAVDIAPHLKPVPALVGVARPAIKSSAAANPVTANELLVPGRSLVGRMAERVPGSVAPCCGAVEEHGLADRGRVWAQDSLSACWCPPTPSPASPALTTRWPFPPRPPRAFPSTSAPNSSFPSAMPSTPKERAPDPSWLSSSRAPEPTSPSSPCSPRWPGAV